MASISKRGNSYRITVSVGRDMEGRQLVRHLTYTPKETTKAAVRREVERAAVEFEERVRSGKYLDGEHMTFVELVDQWKRNYAKKNLPPSTIDSYLAILKNQFYPALGNMKVSKITALHIQSVVNSMSERGLSPGTVRRDFAVLSGILQKAYKWGIVEENVARRCELPKYKKKPIRFWNSDQARTFLKALTLTYHHECKGQERLLGSSGKVYTVRKYDREYTIARVWREFFSLELHTGMRRGELCGLRWCDVDFENKTVSINQVISKRAKGVIVKEPKTESSARTISVSADVINSLRSWKKEQMADSMKFGNLWEGKRGEEYDQNYVFTSPDYPGRPLYPDSVGNKFHAIIREYNEQYGGDLPDINFHGVRHTSATLLIAEGVDVVEVSHRLGHSRTSTTEDVYAHQLRQVDEHAAEVIDDILQRSR